MPKLTVDDLEEFKKTGIKKNYVVKYDPKEFWNELGLTYYWGFDKGSTNMQDTDERSIMLNVGHIFSRIRQLGCSKVLEVGCGFGRILPFVANFGNVEKVVGLEFSDTMIAHSKTYLEKCREKSEGGGEAFNKIEVMKGDITDQKAITSAFKEGEFDCVYTHVCLTHISPERIEDALKNIRYLTNCWVILAERYRWDYEHGYPHVWSHPLARYFSERRWHIHEYCEIHEKHRTKILVIRKPVKQ